MNGSSPFMSFLKLAAFVIAAIGAWYIVKSINGEGNAKIHNMVPAGLATGSFHCWITMEFKKYPADIDLKDVRIVFSSIALDPDNVTFDWKFIAENAQVPKKVGTGRVKAENTSPDKDPPLNYPFDVNFPLNPKMTITTDDSPWMKAELFWGGKKQHQDDASVRFLYKRG